MTANGKGASLDQLVGLLSMRLGHPNAHGMVLTYVETHTACVSTYTPNTVTPWSVSLSRPRWAPASAGACFRPEIPHSEKTK